MNGKIRNAKRGFTLLEILLVIALIGLMGGFLLTDWGNVADSFGRRSWKQTVEEAFRRAHYLAETGDHPVQLRFDPDERILLLESAESGSMLESFPLESVEEIERSSELTGRIRSSFGDGGVNRNNFMVRFGRDGSAESIRFDVIRGSESVSFRNHPFSGRLIEGGAEGDEVIPGER